MRPWALLFLLTGCGTVATLVQDQCESLCRDLAFEVDRCNAFDWADFGVASRNAFINQCQDDWTRERNLLTASDLRRALDDCRVTREVLEELTCQEYITLLGENF